MTARFLFHSPEFKVELSGGEEFVAQQIASVRRKIQAILGGATGVPAPVAAAPATAAAAPVTLDEYFRTAQLREGRGALQDSILVFGHYMSNVQGKPEFTIEDLNFCFDLVGIRRPMSLANTLGIMKRDRRLLQGGSRRGSYVLSEKGLSRAKRYLGV